MRFFNIDQHVSVIADIKNIFTRFGHTVDDWTLSGHAFIFGRKDDRWRIPEMADDAWCAVSNQDWWEEVAEKYKPQWGQYDGYIVTYPPIFARLFAGYGKPVIVDIPIRFDYAVHDKPELLQKLIDTLLLPNVILVANNKFDQEYTEAFIGKRPVHIPSLCEYTGMAYSPRKSKLLAYEHVHMKELDRDLFINKHVALKAGHSWQEVAEFLGAVHFPYQISTMSIFEQYTAGMPLFVPSKKLMMQLWSEGRVLEHMTHYPLWRTAPGSQRKFYGHQYDPNQYKDAQAVSYWLKYADYYDREWMPDVTVFDNISDLPRMIKMMRPNDIITAMKATNVMRKREILSRWDAILKCVS